MNIVDFLTNIGSKFAPVDSGTTNQLRVQLTEQYKKYINRKIEKDNINYEIMEKIKELKNEFKKAEDDSIKFEIDREIENLKSEIQMPTMIEKVCSFFDRPLVKLGLLMFYGILVAIIVRWIQRKKSDVETEDNEVDNSQPPYPYSPYGFGYPPYHGQPSGQPNYRGYR